MSYDMALLWKHRHVVTKLNTRTVTSGDVMWIDWRCLGRTWHKNKPGKGPKNLCIKKKEYDEAYWSRGTETQNELGEMRW